MAAVGVGMATVGTGSGHGAANRRKKIIFALLIGIMAKLTIETRQCDRILRRAVEAAPSVFYVGADGRAVTGGRLTAEAAKGVVTIRSNRLSEKELRRIFAAFLPEAQPE